MKPCDQCGETPAELLIIIMTEAPDDYRYFCNDEHADNYMATLRSLAEPFFSGARCNANLPVCI